MTKQFLFGLLILGFCAVPSTRAHEVKYRAFLDGASEIPVQDTPATGTALITFDLDLVTMRVQSSFSGLKGNTIQAHIHCCTTAANAGTIGVATETPYFASFPIGVTAGSYDHTFDMTLNASYNAPFITNNGGTVGSALNALLTGLDANKAYFNIHTGFAGSGEIRGFLAQVPEPSSIVLIALGMIGLCGRRRKR